ncbi:hypothetical protein AAG906_028126 [Vitis piasezkii]
MALVTLNAFDLILTSQGLNLGTLFEKPMDPDREFIGTLLEDVSTRGDTLEFHKGLVLAK